MVSLAIIIIGQVASWLVLSWALAWSARLSGSARIQLRYGALAAFLLTLIWLVTLAISAAFASLPPGPAALCRVATFVAELAVTFLVLRLIFETNFRRALVPMGMLVALALAQFWLAIKVLRPYVIEAFVTPSKSMSPTLNPGDRFIANKLLAIKRLDLVVFQSHDAQNGIYCRRVVGMPGETLVFKDGGVLVDGKPVQLPTVIAGKCHASVSSRNSSFSRYEDGEQIALGRGEYFLLADDLDRGVDSRMTGPVPAQSMIGVIDLFYWPVARARMLR